MNRALLRRCPPCSYESTRPTLVSVLSLLCRCEQPATGRPPSFDRSGSGSDPGDVRPRPHEGVRHCQRRRLPRRVQEVRCCFRLEVLPQPTPTSSSRSPRGMVTLDGSRCAHARHRVGPVSDQTMSTIERGGATPSDRRAPPGARARSAHRGGVAPPSRSTRTPTVRITASAVLSHRIALCGDTVRGPRRAMRRATRRCSQDPRIKPELFVGVPKRLDDQTPFARHRAGQE